MGLSTPPAKETSHAEPMKVFDNLYFLGMKEFSAWAVNTSEGIIIIDALFDYSVDDEVAEGLKKVGLDPAKIKYVIISHGHSDHSGGAKYLQDSYNARVLLSAADWDLLDRGRGTTPARDLGRHGVQLPAHAGEFQDLCRLRRALRRDRDESRRRRDHLEPLGVRRIEGEDSGAQEPQGRRSESLRHRHRRREALHGDRERVREGVGGTDSKTVTCKSEV